MQHIIISPDEKDYWQLDCTELLGSADVTIISVTVESDGPVVVAFDSFENAIVTIKADATGLLPGVHCQAVITLSLSNGEIIPRTLAFDVRKQ